LPLLRTKKEIFLWLKEGKKTIDVRKGKPYRGDFAYFMSGPNKLQLKIIKKETGLLAEIVRSDNFRRVIPNAETPAEAVTYLRGLYGDYDGVFTAYYVGSQE
jgi:ASC-1-like (ASCH) protein